MRRARLDGLHAAAIAAVGALILYMPVYLMVAGTSLAKGPWGDVALQAFVQGILTAIVSLIFYGRAVSILGASSGAAFAALSPAMTAVMAIPILGEWPTAMDWIAIASISVGVYVVSGGPLPQRRAVGGGAPFNLGPGPSQRFPFFCFFFGRISALKPKLPNTKDEAA